MDRNEIPHVPRHLGVPSCASKMISEPMVRSAQTAHLSCVKISTISTWTANRARLAQTGHLGVPSGASKMISNQLYCTDATDPNEISHDPHHVGVPLSVSTTISKPMVCSAQTKHLSCVKITTISTRTKTSFYLSLVT